VEETWELAAVSEKTNIFLSWSGEYSGAVAAEFKKWIPCVMQEAQTFLSSSDIDPGDRWNEVIGDKLQDYDFGILFITKENINSSWMLFEAGALSKMRETSRVIPMLIDADNLDLSRSPLFHFQRVKMDKDGVFRVMKLVFDEMKESVLQEDTLNKCLEKWWPDLEKSLSGIPIPEVSENSVEVSPDDRMTRIESTLSDVLSLVSSQIHRSSGEVIYRPQFKFASSTPVGSGIYENGEFQQYLNLPKSKSVKIPSTLIRASINDAADITALHIIRKFLENTPMDELPKNIESLIQEVDRRIKELRE